MHATILVERPSPPYGISPQCARVRYRIQSRKQHRVYPSYRVGGPLLTYTIVEGMHDCNCVGITPYGSLFGNRWLHTQPL